jgi:hypothetical protein
MSAENTGGTRCYRHAPPDTLLGRKRTEFGIADRLRIDRVAKQVLNLTDGHVLEEFEAKW